jgi:PAS domain S-box-containing protein
VYAFPVSFQSTVGLEIDPLSVADLIAFQRGRNARTIALTLVGLDLLTILAIAAVNPALGVLLAMGACAVAGALCAAAIVRGHVQVGVLSLIAINLSKHVAVVVALGDISILPLFASVVVMIAAATLGGRRIAWVLVLALLTIGIECALGIHYGGTRTTLLAPVLGGIVLALAAAVISMLSVRETERALRLAEERDRLRQRAVEEARASEERHRLIADSTDDLIALVDESGQIEYLSSSYGRLLGRDLSSESGNNLVGAILAEDRAVMLAALARARADGHATATLRLTTAKGEHLTYEARLSRVTRGERQLVAFIGRDMTVRLELEDRVRKVQRMEALDRLSRGIAHDFNNLLGVIVGASDLIAANLRSPESIRGDLQIIREALESAKGLTQQLLTFSRKQVAVSQVLEVGATLRGLRDIVQRLVGNKIRVELATDDQLHARVSKSQLEQIVMNVAANARDAMPDGGTFALRAHRRTIAAGEVTDLEAGVFVEIAACDTGTGIALDVLPHMFEPFFTTKPASRGTGLGLATCYGIARQLGGTILIDTEMGRGSTFRVLLPTDSCAPQAVDAELTPPAGSPGQRVLVVDDEEQIIKLVGRMLGTAGFDVVTASTLAEAERVLKDGSRPLDVLVTDVMLGNDRGTTLVPLARERHPRIRIVVISGYASEPEATSTILGKQVTFLAKPFDRQALLGALAFEPQGQ